MGPLLAPHSANLRHGACLQTPTAAACPPTMFTPVCECCPAHPPYRGRFESEYEVLGELGRGAFGCALKARQRSDGTLVCLKVLQSDRMGASERRMVSCTNGPGLGLGHWGWVSQQSDSQSLHATMQHYACMQALV